MKKTTEYFIWKTQHSERTWKLNEENSAYQVLRYKLYEQWRPDKHVTKETRSRKRCWKIALKIILGVFNWIKIDTCKETWRDIVKIKITLLKHLRFLCTIRSCYRMWFGRGRVLNVLTRSRCRTQPLQPSLAFGLAVIGIGSPLASFHMSFLTLDTLAVPYLTK